MPQSLALSWEFGRSIFGPIRLIMSTVNYGVKKIAYVVSFCGATVGVVYRRGCYACHVF